MAAQDLITRFRSRLEERVEAGKVQAASILEESLRAEAPRDTGALAASIEVRVEGDRIVASSPLPYAAIQDARQGYVGRAYTASRQQIGEAIVRGGK